MQYYSSVPRNFFHHCSCFSVVVMLLVVVKDKQAIKILMTELHYYRQILSFILSVYNCVILDK